VQAAVADFLDNPRAGASLKLLTPIDGPEPPQFELAGGRRIAGGALRRMLSTSAHPLYSPRFSANREGSEIVFHGRGHGHGVGLCQWGADGQAVAGKSTLEILRHYYPGCRVVRIR
jgi:stage II sporulation protein D